MTNQTPQTPDKKPPHSEIRRKLIRAGLATGPVVATLTSTKVLGAQCVAPSQTLSKGASIDMNRFNQDGDCTGLKASDWKNTTRPDPAGINRSVALFHNFFTMGSTPNVNKFVKPNNTSMTIQEVLNLGGANGSNIAYAMCAALMNTYSNRINFPVGGIVSSNSIVMKLQEVWIGWTGAGYRPYAGAPIWTDADILRYFDKQGIVPNG